MTAAALILAAWFTAGAVVGFASWRWTHRTDRYATTLSDEAHAREPARGVSVWCPLCRRWYRYDHPSQGRAARAYHAEFRCKVRKAVTR